LQGYVDLMNVEGRIIDLNTGAREPTGISHDIAFPLTSYAIITAGGMGRCRLDTVPKKTMQIVQEFWRIDADDQRYARRCT
jgi:hypothetical protein